MTRASGPIQQNQQASNQYAQNNIKYRRKIPLANHNMSQEYSSEQFYPNNPGQLSNGNNVFSHSKANLNASPDLNCTAPPVFDENHESFIQMFNAVSDSQQRRILGGVQGSNSWLEQFKKQGGNVNAQMFAPPAGTQNQNQYQKFKVFWRLFNRHRSSRSYYNANDFQQHGSGQFQTQQQLQNCMQAQGYKKQPKEQNDYQQIIDNANPRVKNRHQSEDPAASLGERIGAQINRRDSSKKFVNQTNLKEDSNLSTEPNLLSASNITQPDSVERNSHNANDLFKQKNQKEDTLIKHSSKSGGFIRVYRINKNKPGSSQSSSVNQTMPTNMEIVASECKRSITGLPSAGNPNNLDSSLLRRGDSTEMKNSGGKLITSLCQIANPPPVLNRGNSENTPNTRTKAHQSNLGVTGVKSQLNEAMSQYIFSYHQPAEEKKTDRFDNTSRTNTNSGSKQPEEILHPYSSNLKSGMLSTQSNLSNVPAASIYNQQDLSAEDQELQLMQLIQKKQWHSQLRSKSQSSSRPKFGKNVVALGNSNQQNVVPHGNPDSKGSPNESRGFNQTNNISQHQLQQAQQQNMFIGGVSQQINTMPSTSVLSKTQKLPVNLAPQCAEIKGEKVAGDRSDQVPRDVELMKAQIQIDNYKMKLMKLQKEQDSSQSPLQYQHLHQQQVFPPTMKELECFFRQTARNLCKNHLRIFLLVTSQQIIQEREKNIKYAQQQKRRGKIKNPNCNHNNNSVFYQPNYNHVMKGSDRFPKNKQEALEAILSFIDAPVLDIRDKTKKKGQSGSSDSKAKDQSSTSNITSTDSTTSVTKSHLRSSSSNRTIEQENQDLGQKYLNIIESYFPELKELSRPHKKLLMTLLATDLSKDSFIDILKELMVNLNFKDKKCIYCSQTAFGQFKQMEFTKVRNFMKITHLDPVTFVLRSLLDPVPKTIKDQQNSNSLILKKVVGGPLAATSLSPSPAKQPKGFKKGPGAQDLKKKNNTKIVFKEDPIPPWKNPSFKDKDKALEMKEKAFYDFINKQRKSNKLPPISLAVGREPQRWGQYKFFIGKGNNSFLVKHCFKQYRWWWQQGKPNKDDWTQLNFVWTQWRNVKILSQMKQLCKDGPSSYSIFNTNGISSHSESTNADTISTNSEPKNAKIDTQRSSQLTPKKAQRELSSKRKSISDITAIAQKDPLKPQSSRSTHVKGVASQDEKPVSKKIVQEPLENYMDKCREFTQYSHMENNFQISNKKALFYNMKIYYEALGEDLFNYIPITFHIKEGVNDKEFKKFEEKYKELQSEDGVKNVWIVKPGENTNRGCGITVCKDLNAVRDVVGQNVFLRNGSKRSYIVQKYLENPLLFNKRKFDIRCYSLITCINGNYQAYWYTEGYLRTSSKEYSLKNCANKLIHLTNDAIQKRADDYGKFENGNKVSFADFQKYLDTNLPDLKCDFKKQIFPQLKNLATDTVKAVSKKIDPKKRQNTFELFGYDFMIDTDLKVYLIEVNTNPCLELSAPLLQRLIPQLLENVVKIAVDPLYPPSDVPAQKRALLPDVSDNKFELVFNEDTDSAQLSNLPIHDTLIDVVAEEDIEEDAAGEESEDDEGSEGESYGDSDNE